VQRSEDRPAGTSPRGPKADFPIARSLAYDIVVCKLFPPGAVLRHSEERTVKIEECIFYQLSKANQAAARFLNERLASSNVTAVQGVVMNFLSEEDEITSKQLGQRTKLDSATLTGILDRLEAMALIERRANPADRRAILICLTKKGKKLASDVHKTIEKANGDLLTGFGVQEERGFRAMLRRVHHG
jgi:DNA-binding MarR family transcriptional regulator